MLHTKCVDFVMTSLSIFRVVHLRQNQRRQTILSTRQTHLFSCSFTCFLKKTLRKCIRMLYFCLVYLLLFSFLLALISKENLFCCPLVRSGKGKKKKKTPEHNVWGKRSKEEQTIKEVKSKKRSLFFSSLVRRVLFFSSVQSFIVCDALLFFVCLCLLSLKFKERERQRKRERDKPLSTTSFPEKFCSFAESRCASWQTLRFPTQGCWRWWDWQTVWQT